MNQKTKQIIIIIIVIVISFIGFKMFFANDEPTDVALVSEGTNPQVFVDGQAILILLDKLKQVTLDDSIFASPAFTNLVSFERPIQSQVLGRQNPFLPIGVDTAGAVRAVSTSSSAL